MFYPQLLKLKEHFSQEELDKLDGYLQQLMPNTSQRITASKVHAYTNMPIEVCRRLLIECKRIGVMKQKFILVCPECGAMIKEFIAYDEIMQGEYCLCGYEGEFSTEDVIVAYELTVCKNSFWEGQQNEDKYYIKNNNNFAALDKIVCYSEYFKMDVELGAMAVAMGITNQQDLEIATMEERVRERADIIFYNHNLYKKAICIASVPIYIVIMWGVIKIGANETVSVSVGTVLEIVVMIVANILFGKSYNDMYEEQKRKADTEKITMIREQLKQME